jgi:hypothetical protein
MTKMADSVRLIRRATWGLRNQVLDVLFTHEVTCEVYKVQEAGLYLVGWSVGDFVVAALENDPSQLKGLR